MVVERQVVGYPRSVKFAWKEAKCILSPGCCTLVSFVEVERGGGERRGREVVHRFACCGGVLTLFDSQP